MLSLLPIIRSGIHSRVGLDEETVRAKATEILGVPLDADVETLFLAITRRWRSDPDMPVVFVGPYRRDEANAANMVDVGVMLFDADGVPDIPFRVGGSDLDLVLPHVVLLLDDYIQERRATPLMDQTWTLSGGESLHFRMLDRHEMDGNLKVLRWGLYMVWGRHRQALYEGVKHAAEVKPGDARAFLVQLCASPPMVDTDAQRHFAAALASELKALLTSGSVRV